MWARLGEKGDKASEKGKKVLEKMPPTSTRDKISYSGIFPKSFKLPCEKRCTPKNPNPDDKQCLLYKIINYLSVLR